MSVSVPPEGRGTLQDRTRRLELVTGGNVSGAMGAITSDSVAAVLATLKRHEQARAEREVANSIMAACASALNSAMGLPQSWEGAAFGDAVIVPGRLPPQPHLRPVSQPELSLPPVRVSTSPRSPSSVHVPHLEAITLRTWDTSDPAFSSSESEEQDELCDADDEEDEAAVPSKLT